ncbi:MAG: hypothetical protein K2Q12_06245 [Rickettsiales bacterium]|nr:hypothetical protein [Rickettsiales bacterium]
MTKPLHAQGHTTKQTSWSSRVPTKVAILDPKLMRAFALLDSITLDIAALTKETREMRYGPDVTEEADVIEEINAA